MDNHFIFGNSATCTTLLSIYHAEALLKDGIFIGFLPKKAPYSLFSERRQINE